MFENEISIGVKPNISRIYGGRGQDITPPPPNAPCYEKIKKYYIKTNQILKLFYIL